MSPLVHSRSGLEHLVGHFETEPTVVAQMIGRKKTEPLKSKPAETQIEGPLFILVDSETPVRRRSSPGIFREKAGLPSLQIRRLGK